MRTNHLRPARHLTGQVMVRHVAHLFLHLFTRMSPSHSIRRVLPAQTDVEIHALLHKSCILSAPEPGWSKTDEAKSPHHLSLAA